MKTVKVKKKAKKAEKLEPVKEKEKRLCCGTIENMKRKYLDGERVKVNHSLIKNVFSEDYALARLKT